MSQRKIPLALLLLGVISVFGMMLLNGAVLWGARNDARALAVQAGVNLNRAIAHQLDEDLTLIEMTLQSIRTTVQDPKVAALAPEVRHKVIFARAAAVRGAGEFAVIDETGAVVFDSLSILPRTTNLGKRAYFIAHQEHADLGLHVSAPFIGGLHGQWLIAFSIRLSDEHGAFRGVVVGTLRLDHLQRVIAPFDIGPGGVITLSRADGVVLAHHPVDAGLIGADFGDHPNHLRSQGAGMSTFEAVSMVDGTPRLYTTTLDGAARFRISVAQSQNDVYRSWRERAFLSGALTLAMAGAILMLVMLFSRELTRRMDGEARLQRANRTLEDVARTDPLTGIANRRSFDEALVAEWRRCAREGCAMSVVMVDIDNFKALNDSLGHQHGDTVLRQVAQAMAGCLGRAGDLAARYGGEEFAAVLPNTPAHGARTIAEEIRVAVEALGLEHPTSPSGVTVSCGWSATKPYPALRPEALIARADAALYTAKRNGRNRVEGGEVPPDGA